MDKNRRVLVLAGTRPEAVKMAPVIQALRADREFQVTVCATGQHREMLAQAFSDFNIVPDINLDVMTQGQTLAGLSSILFSRLDELLEKHAPDWLLIQGDTTTVMIAALCAFYRNIRIGHVEAGLRSFNKRSPFPEEINRKVAALVADAHFAPTKKARENLLKEGVPGETVITTGNTVADALMHMVKEIHENKADLPEEIEGVMKPGNRIILVTAHRRENHGEPLENICRAILEITSRRKNVQVILPVHLNPAVRGIVYRLLANKPQILLTEPLSYKHLLSVMERSELILTDSGGIQEEGCILRKPVLVLRDTTERMEGIEAGAARLLGTGCGAITANSLDLLDNAETRSKMAENAGELYGDGQAAIRIARFLAENT